MRPPLDSLFDLARRGDPRAFETLTEALGAELLRFLTHLLRGDEHAALDAVQETLLEAWRNLDSIRSPDHLRRWLFTVARCRAVSWMRRRAPPGTRPHTLSGDPPSDREEDAPDGSARALERSRRRAAILWAIDLLPPRYGGPVRLHYLHGFDTRETARLLGVPRTNVKMRLHRARTFLRRALQRRPPGASSRAAPRGPEAP